MTTSPQSIAQGLPCLNPVFNDAAPGQALNGKILIAQDVSDVAALKAPDVSAILLDASDIPAVQGLMDFIAAGRAKNEKALKRQLGKIVFPPRPLIAYRTFLRSVFDRTAFNGHFTESAELGAGGPVSGRSVRFNEHVFGKNYKYSVVTANLGRGEGADKGLKYLLTPVTLERYRSAIEGKAWRDVARDNPDLEWGELKPGQVLIYKGGKPGVQGPVLVSGGPDVEGGETYARYDMSDEYYPVPLY
jgi:hypothetical protein